VFVNALFGPPDSAIDVAVHTVAGGPSIAVADAAPGVALADRQMIFERSRAADRGRDPRLRARPGHQRRAGRADGRLAAARAGATRARFALGLLAAMP
jgi:hypothetical protein